MHSSARKRAVLCALQALAIAVPAVGMGYLFVGSIGFLGVAQPATFILAMAMGAITFVIAEFVYRRVGDEFYRLTLPILVWGPSAVALVIAFQMHGAQRSFDLLAIAGFALGGCVGELLTARWEASRA